MRTCQVPRPPTLSCASSASSRLSQNEGSSLEGFLGLGTSRSLPPSPGCSGSSAGAGPDTTATRRRLPGRAAAAAAGSLRRFLSGPYPIAGLVGSLAEVVEQAILQLAPARTAAVLTGVRQPDHDNWTVGQPSARCCQRTDVSRFERLRSEPLQTTRLFTKRFGKLRADCGPLQARQVRPNLAAAAACREADSCFHLAAACGCLPLALLRIRLCSYGLGCTNYFI